MVIVRSDKEATAARISHTVRPRSCLSTDPCDEIASSYSFPKVWGTAKVGCHQNIKLPSAKYDGMGRIGSSRATRQFFWERTSGEVHAARLAAPSGCAHNWRAPEPTKAPAPRAALIADRWTWIATPREDQTEITPKAFSAPDPCARAPGRRDELGAAGDGGARRVRRSHLVLERRSGLWSKVLQRCSRAGINNNDGKARAIL